MIELKDIKKAAPSPEDWYRMPVAVRRSNLTYDFINPQKAYEDHDAGLLLTDEPKLAWVHWTRNGFKDKDFHTHEECTDPSGCVRLRLRAAIRVKERMPLRNMSGRMSPSVESPQEGSYHQLLDNFVNGGSREIEIFESWKFSFPVNIYLQK